MTSRQTALLENHIDIASLGTTSTAPVCVILDLEDKVAFEIASIYQPNCAQNRDTIKAAGAYPAVVLALPLEGANALIAGISPAKKIRAIPDGMTPVIVVSEARCLVALVPRINYG